MLRYGSSSMFDVTCVNIRSFLGLVALSIALVLSALSLALAISDSLVRWPKIVHGIRVRGFAENYAHVMPNNSEHWLV